jgi:hypothetical protein
MLMALAPWPMMEPSASWQSMVIDLVIVTVP